MVCSRLLLFFVGSLAASLTAGCPSPFVLLEGQWCIFVNITAPPLTGPGRPVTWLAARESCQSANGDLVVLDNHKKLQAISKHIDQSFPTETETAYVYWVGAQGTGNNWQWVNSKPVNLQSNNWVPDQPSEASATTTQYGKLVPADSTHGRRYLVTAPSNGISPAHICEKH